MAMTIPAHLGVAPATGPLGVLAGAIETRASVIARPEVFDERLDRLLSSGGQVIKTSTSSAAVRYIALGFEEFERSHE